MKKKFMLVLIVLFVFTVMHTAAEQGELLPIDAVLVLDVSLSMRTADPEGLSRKAMNLFIEMLTEGRDRVGVVAYAGQVERSRAMTTIRGRDCRDSFGEFIDGLELAGWTDHGLGLLEAMRIMRDGQEEGRQSVVILLTDGNLNVNPSGPRSNETARRDIELALELAREYSITIYTIGLNFDGNLDAEYIEHMAEGGLSFETTAADDLPGIMREIFAAMLRENLQAAEPPPKPPEPLPKLPPIEQSLPPPVEEPPPVIEPEPPTYENSGVLNLAGLGIGLTLSAAALLLYAKLRPARVFTGQLTLETIAAPPRRLNLIEYGRRATLQKLAGDANPLLGEVTLMPSPNAPSHLPKLLLKCKNPKIKFIKDFIENDASRGITLGTGAELTIKLETEGKEIRMKYQ